jgi:hypothetical protein
MTLLPHVFMLEADTVLDGTTIRHIQQIGYGPAG